MIEYSLNVVREDGIYRYIFTSKPLSIIHTDSSDTCYFMFYLDYINNEEEIGDVINFFKSKINCTPYEINFDKQDNCLTFLMDFEGFNDSDVILNKIKTIFEE